MLTLFTETLPNSAYTKFRPCKTQPTETETYAKLSSWKIHGRKIQPTQKLAYSQFRLRKR